MRASPGAGSPVRRVLAIDDDRDYLILLDKLLSPHVRLEVLLSGKDIVKMISRDPPDMIILDVHMPNPNGIKVCRSIKAAMHPRELPVLLLTHDSSPETRAEGLDAGAIAVVEKGNGARTILKLMRELCGVST